MSDRKQPQTFTLQASQDSEEKREGQQQAVPQAYPLQYSQFFFKDANQARAFYPIQAQKYQQIQNMRKMQAQERAQNHLLQQQAYQAEKDKRWLTAIAIKIKKNLGVEEFLAIGMQNKGQEIVLGFNNVDNYFRIVEFLQARGLTVSPGYSEKTTYQFILLLNRKQVDGVTFSAHIPAANAAAAYDVPQNR